MTRCSVQDTHKIPSVLHCTEDQPSKCFHLIFLLIATKTSPTQAPHPTVISLRFEKRSVSLTRQPCRQTTSLGKGTATFLPSCSQWIPLRYSPNYESKQGPWNVKPLFRHFYFKILNIDHFCQSIRL